MVAKSKDNYGLSKNKRKLAKKALIVVKTHNINYWAFLGSEINITRNMFARITKRSGVSFLTDVL